jgi:hypothetical protein
MEQASEKSLPMPQEGYARLYGNLIVILFIQGEEISYRKLEFNENKIITFRKKRRLYEYHRKSIDARVICSFAS